MTSARLSPLSLSNKAFLKPKRSNSQWSKLEPSEFTLQHRSQKWNILSNKATDKISLSHKMHGAHPMGHSSVVAGQETPDSVKGCCRYTSRWLVQTCWLINCAKTSISSGEHCKGHKQEIRKVRVLQLLVLLLAVGLVALPNAPATLCDSSPE